MRSHTRKWKIPRRYGDQKYECDRCGFPFLKHDLREQRGLLVCEKCWDEPDPRDTEDYS